MCSTFKAQWLAQIFSILETTRFLRFLRNNFLVVVFTVFTEQLSFAIRCVVNFVSKQLPVLV